MFTDFGHWLFRKDLHPRFLANFWMYLLSQFCFPLLFVSSPIFLNWSPVKHLRGSFLEKLLADLSRQLLLRESSIVDACLLNVFLNSILMLLYYQHYHSFSFIYLVTLSFPCYIILALIAVIELLRVIISHFFWCWDTLLLTLEKFLYFFSFLSHLFIKRCLLQSQFIHIF